MKKILTIIVALAAVSQLPAQTLNVVQGEVIYQIPASQADDMLFSDGTSVNILGKEYVLSAVDQMYIDNSTVVDNTVDVAYNGSTATVKVAGNVARYLTVTAAGSYITIEQSADVSEEITYTLSGTSTDGAFVMDGEYKASFVLNGLDLTSKQGAAIHIKDGKRISVTLADGTTNTLSDSEGGSQKACFAVKGHTEFKGNGTLNITGNTAHAFWSKEYVQLKKSTGTINILGAVGDGFNVNQYFLQNGGTVVIKNVGDDGLQVSYKTDDNDAVIQDEDNTGQVTINAGMVDITTAGDAAKGIKSASDVNILGGTVKVTQTGSITVDGTDISYSTGVKAGGDINVSGGTVIINNTADGGKGLSAEGNISIDESNGTTVVDITANGKGGTAETTGSDEPDQTKSYKIYVSLPSSGGGMGPGGSSSNVWRTVSLYKSDGTLIQQLSSTVTKSSGYSTVTFYYYDFKEADSDTYYFKSADYTSRGTTYTIRSATFSGPASGSDIYYSISNSYSTSGTTRTYSLTNVTNTYGGSTDVSEDEGTAYNAAGLKADGNVTIAGGTVTISNNGAMSKSIKSKAITTINGGDIMLKPSGAMQVINSDASYSSGVKTVSFVQNDGKIDITATGAASRGVSAKTIVTNGGTLTITNSGAGQSGANDSYTAKGLKADTSIALNDGTINITMSGTGGKGIKSSGIYTQGTTDGNGPTLSVTTTGSSLGGSTGGGGWGPGGGMGSNNGSSAKAIKVQGTIVVYGGETTVSTATNGAEGLESKTSVDIRGGKHYFKCYDDCINSSGLIYFNGGVTVAYSNGNDAIDSNAGRTGAITIGDGIVVAYTSAGSPEEGLDCDNNSYIQITGTGIAISAGGSQGGGGGWGGGSSGNTISNAKQGYYFYTSSVSYASGRYYTLADASGNNLITYSFPTSVSSTLALFTATGMVKGSTYNVKYSTTAPTDAATDFHGVYLGSSHSGTTSVLSFTAQ
ncbi:MAG: carbohydrate-binding domain-containing protein [Prevotella sp.]|nr:carbohydrate-binding domain-containing protein [Prevotella sp.]